MIGYKYPNKDRRIKVYRLIRTEKDDGTIVTEKHYVHPKGTELKTYMVGIVAQSQNSPTKIPVNQTSFVVNWKDTISTECYIENCGITYQITGIDPLDYRKTEMRIVGQSTTAPSFDSVTYAEA